MAGEYEQHIPRILELGLDQIHPDQTEHVASFFGSDFVTPATPEEAAKASKYLASPVRQMMEKTLAGALWGTIGIPFTRISSWYINHIDPPNDGIYKMEVGFDGKTEVMSKIRTLRDGADGINKPFYGPSFANSDERYNKQLIIRGKFARVLRSGFDEFPQLPLVGTKMSLVGVRGYMQSERESNRILLALAQSGDIAVSDQVRWVLENHNKILLNQGIKPGIANPRACLNQKTVSHMVRLWLDIQYAQKASLGLDLLIFSGNFLKRFRKLERAIVQ